MKKLQIILDIYNNNIKKLVAIWNLNNKLF